MILAVSTIELTLRMLVALAIIGGLLAMGARIAKRKLKLGGSEATIEVQSRHQLTKSSAVAVVRAGRRHVLIGVNDNAITLLAEGDDLVGPSQGSIGANQAVVDVRGGQDRTATTSTNQGGARKRRRGVSGPAPSGTRVMEALRERTVRRS